MNTLVKIVHWSRKMIKINLPKYSDRMLFVIHQNVNLVINAHISNKCNMNVRLPFVCVCGSKIKHENRFASIRDNIRISNHKIFMWTCIQNKHNK